MFIFKVMPKTLQSLVFLLETAVFLLIGIEVVLYLFILVISVLLLRKM